MECPLCREAMSEFREHLEQRHPIAAADSEGRALLVKCLELASLAEAAGSRLVPSARDDFFSHLHRTISFFLGLQAQSGQLKPVAHSRTELKPGEDKIPKPSPTLASQLGSVEEEGSLQNTQTVSLESGQQQGGFVLHLSGLCPRNFTCDRLFNLVCLYGDVIRIKLLLNRMGVAALVEMADWEGVECCIQSLDGLFVFGRQIRANWSDKEKVIKTPGPFFKDFCMDELNRFQNLKMAHWNRRYPPSRHLCFFHTPPDLTQTDIHTIFDKFGLAQPNSIKINLTQDGKRSFGFVHFDEMATASEVLVLANHFPIFTEGTKGRLFKVAFATENED